MMYDSIAEQYCVIEELIVIVFIRMHCESCIVYAMVYTLWVMYCIVSLLVLIVHCGMYLYCALSFSTLSCLYLNALKR